jgi:hypothetical protein
MPTDDVQITAYVDASHGLHADGKSQTGCAITIGGGAVYTKCSKQKIVAKSSTEAELIAVTDSLSYILWFKQFLTDLLGHEQRAVTVMQDNTSTIALATNGKSSSDMTKHIKVRHFLIKQHIEEGDVIIKHCPTKEMWADLLTKPLQGSLFWDHLSNVSGQNRRELSTRTDNV